MRDLLDKGRTMEMFPPTTSLIEKPEVALASIEYEKGYNLQMRSNPESAVLGGRYMATGLLRQTYGYKDVAIDAAIEAIEEFRKRPAQAQPTQPKTPANGHSTQQEVAAVEVRSAAPNAEAEQTHASERPPQANFVDRLPDVPAAMKAQHQWVRWKLEPGSNGTMTKVPYRVDGGKASSTNTDDWADYKTAVTGAEINSSGGVGFMFANGFMGIDLDGCRDTKTGDITKWAEDIIDSLGDVYVEASPSGTGLHIFVLGKVPGNDKKFNLNPAIGYGKAAIEIYDSRRYFTVTGDKFFDEAGDVLRCDLKEIYKKFHELRAANPAPRNERAESADAAASAGEPTKIEQLGTFSTTKYDIFSQGEIESRQPSFVISNRIGRLTYPSQSEADMAFATVLAITHNGDADKINEEFCKSALYRPKWERTDYRNNTIAKAIATAKTSSVPTVSAPAASAPKADYNDALTVIPPFDPSVMNGIYKKFVDLATRGTTLTPQFAYAIAKTIVGARMAGHVYFENLDVEPRYYLAMIGESGSGKGTAWRRMLDIITADMAVGNAAAIKIINSADSGAGIRDIFFEKPQDAPVLMYIDEVRSLGNKSTATKQPEILDRLIELADSTQVSVVKASRNAKSSSKTSNNARLCSVMCGQDGNVYMAAFAGSTKLGLWDRLYPEYGEVVEPGDLPRIIPMDALQLMQEFNALNFSGKLTMSEAAKDCLKQFWDAQPIEVRKKARWKKNMQVDAFMSAFGRGVREVELEDAVIATKIFTRQLVIRQEHFTQEVPDRTGYYLGLIKRITETMRRQLAAGLDPYFVALTRRDYEKRTNANRDNEEHLFEKAWVIHSKHHLQPVNIKKANGQTYAKYIPIPDEMPD